MICKNARLDGNKLNRRFLRISSKFFEGSLDALDTGAPDLSPEGKDLSIVRGLEPALDLEPRP